MKRLKLEEYVYCVTDKVYNKLLAAIKTENERKI